MQTKVVLKIITQFLEKSKGEEREGEEGEKGVEGEFDGILLW